MSPAAGSRIQLLLGAVLFSTGGAVIKSLHFDGPFNGWQIACLRALIAGLTVLAILPAARRSWTWKILPVGLAYSGALLFFVLSNNLTTSANTIFLQSTSPLYILILGPWILKESLRKRDLPFMAVLAVGMALFFIPTGNPGQPTAPNPLLGNVLGIASGICMAVLFTGLRWFAKREGEQGGTAANAVVVGSFILFLASLPMTFPWPAPRAIDLLLVGYLGVFQIGIAYVLVTRAMRRISALEAMLLLLLEPVLNPIWTWFVHAEDPGIFAVLGGVVILAATGFRSIRRRPDEDPAH